MSIFSKIWNYINNPVVAIRVLLNLLAPLVKNDAFFIKMKWKLSGIQYELDLKSPITFNSKIQWLKLHDRNPLYTKMVDKATAKDYVSSIIGNEYIIPTIAVWESTNDIDWSILPRQFVMKCTHDSGGLIVCRNKDELNKNDAIKHINKYLKRRYFWQNREWPYKDVKPRIIVEEYMEDYETGELRDYKFFCFDGVVRALFIASDRLNKNEDTKFDFFDADFNHLPIFNGHPNSKNIPNKPYMFNKMKELASRLSVGIPQIRVDFYEVNRQIFFGELTFSHWSGMVPFKPVEWDYKFGEWIDLSLIKQM